MQTVLSNASGFPLAEGHSGWSAHQRPLPLHATREFLVRLLSSRERPGVRRCAIAVGLLPSLSCSIFVHLPARSRVGTVNPSFWHDEFTLEKTCQANS